jgi:chemosensory pili system protein ChpC
MPERAFSRRDSLSALLLPLAERQLLVPDVAVAELIGYRTGVPTDAGQPWDLGDVAWRGRHVPLVSFEGACGQPLPRGERVRIAVMHGIGKRLPFFALVIQGIPRTVRLDSQLSYIDVPLTRLELAAVVVGSEVARVPNLDALAETIAQARLTAE